MGTDRKVSDTDLIAMMPYVRKVAVVTCRSYPGHVKVEDMFAAGYEGLVDAANKYDPTRGVPFAKYAVLRIKGSMGDYARSVDWLSRRDREKHPDAQQPVSLQTSFTSGRTDSTEVELSDMIVDPADVEHAVEVRTLILDVLPRLPPRSQWVIVARYWCDETQAQIGVELGVSGSRVNQIEMAALHKMRDWIDAA